MTFWQALLPRCSFGMALLLGTGVWTLLVIAVRWVWS